MLSKINENIKNKIFRGALAATVLICSLLTICGCDKEDRFEMLIDNNKVELESMGAENTEIESMKSGNTKTESLEPEKTELEGVEYEETESENMGAKMSEEETIIDGDKFYDLGKGIIVDRGDSCFMEPILQNPTSNGVTVQWFTQNSGEDNYLCLYASLEDSEQDNYIKKYPATTTKLSRIRGGKNDKEKNNPAIECDIYKHVAIVEGLPEYHGLIEERRYYKVVTDEEQSKVYSLAARATEGTPMRILLTSDHQVKDMVAANIQKVYETVGSVDAIFMNGDLVDVTDRAYDWFYKDNAFFKCLTGTAFDEVNGAYYYGAPLLQQAPIYTSIGNHDVMGVYDDKKTLDVQFNEPRPREQAERKYETADLKIDITREEYIENNSYNTITTEEIFENPRSDIGGEKYYAVTVGDIRLIVLDISRIWRLSNIGVGGKYSEIPGNSTNDYSGGEFIFESIKEGSEQIDFLDKEIEKDEYKNAKIKMVMFHSEAHSLGGNQSPAFTDPVAKEVISPVTGQKMTIYDYPIDEDYIINVVEPRLIRSGTQLLFEAHSHLWNRFVTESGMNILESSNVGNSYGGFDDENKVRTFYPSAFDKNDQYHKLADEWDKNNYPEFGDPYGLTPIAPNVSNLPDNKPYLDSNTITAFSILDTYKGTVDSYYFDTKNPESDVVLFDSFRIYKK